LGLLLEAIKQNHQVASIEAAEDSENIVPNFHPYFVKSFLALNAF
jgi:hypothetical protein